MKSAQWLAVLLLALMVGGITFVMVYLGGSSRQNTGESAAPAAVLTFAVKRYPDEGSKAPVSEVHQYGHHDFWFYNDNDREVTVGLNNKGCTCSEVELAIAPPEWKPRLLAEAAGRLLQRAPRGLDGLPTLAATYERERVYPDLTESGVTTTPLTRESTVIVPAGAVGWVRLRWNRSQPGPFTTFADLWMGRRDGNANAMLELAALIAPAAEVNKELSAGTLSPRDLEAGKRVWIVVWSATRRSFQLQVSKAVEGKAESDPVEVGDPVPLKSADLRRLEKMDKAEMIEARSGYRIPVTLRAKAPDGTPFGLGHFRRYVKLTSPDDGIEPMEVRVGGEVQGDVTVGDPKERGVINLGPFPRSRGAHGSIVLHTDRKDIELKLDTSRVPSFLKVRFPSRPEETPSGHRMWLLEVEVPPDAAWGDFPRENEPAYRDSAVYVTTGEKPPRSIRIPVAGTAN